MSAAEVTRDRVEERLGSLEDAYSDFPVNQTTIAVSRAAYERASERCEHGIVDAYVQLYNERDDVLLVEDDDEWVVPHGEPRTDERIVAGTERAVREQTGVECTLDDLSRVTILGVRDEDDPDRPPMYRMITVFSAETDCEAVASADPSEVATTDGSRWHPTLPDSAVPTH